MTVLEHRPIHQRMKAAAAVARLPLRSGQWSGVTGSVLGQGTGSSIDFQDQRPYMPGDDPRHINWQAYARSGNYTMKLYREEVSPRVDLLFDASPSMFLTDAKAQRTWELAYFCIESCLRLGASLKILTLGLDAVETPLEHALAYQWPIGAGASVPGSLTASLSRAALRTGSMRVLLSDLLIPAPPESILPQLVAGKGRPIFLVPYCKEESEPDWSGNVEFEECESRRREKRRVEKPTLQRYLRAYQTHFSLWREQCARHNAPMGRIPSELNFLTALHPEAAPAHCIDIG